MTKAAAFQATIHGFRTVPSRGVVSITIEAPIEQHAEIAKIAVHGAWVAVARLQDSKEVMPNTQSSVQRLDARPQPSQPQAGAKREKIDWRNCPPAQQAGMRCDDPVFAAFLKEQYGAYWINYEDAAATVRDICEVESRKELATNQKALVIWHQLDRHFQAWEAKERVGA